MALRAVELQRGGAVERSRFGGVRRRDLQRAAGIDRHRIGIAACEIAEHHQCLAAADLEPAGRTRCRVGRYTEHQRLHIAGVQGAAMRAVGAHDRGRAAVRRDREVRARVGERRLVEAVAGAASERIRGRRSERTDELVEIVDTVATGDGVAIFGTGDVIGAGRREQRIIQPAQAQIENIGGVLRSACIGHRDPAVAQHGEVAIRHAAMSGVGDRGDLVAALVEFDHGSRIVVAIDQIFYALGVSAAADAGRHDPDVLRIGHLVCRLRDQRAQSTEHRELDLAVGTGAVGNRLAPGRRKTAPRHTVRRIQQRRPGAWSRDGVGGGRLEGRQVRLDQEADIGIGAAVKIIALELDIGQIDVAGVGGIGDGKDRGIRHGNPVVAQPAGIPELPCWHRRGRCRSALDGDDRTQSGASRREDLEVFLVAS